MRDRTTRRHIMLALLPFMAVLACGALHICQHCGHENEREAPTCTHCSVPFPLQETSPDKPITETAETPDTHLHRQIINTDIAEGQKQIQERNYELARFFFLNALALEGLAPPQDAESRAQELLGLIQAAEQSARIVNKTCLSCSGRGQQPVVFEGLRAQSSRSNVTTMRSFSQEGHSTVVCTECRGAGNVDAPGTIADLTFARNAAEAAYVQYQQARRYEPLGGTWVPAQIVDTLSVRQTATIMRSLVLACRSCTGFGRADCRNCEGLGRVNCGNCRDGRIFDLSRSGDRVQRIGGTDRTTECPNCSGMGTLPCGSCDATGTQACRRCGGSGNAEVCRTCETRGFVTCRRCRGTQIMRGEPCPACRAEGETLCTSCRGRGRRQ